VIGIGASAGELEAVTELLSGIKTSDGLAFLLVQHLDPHQPSLLTEIIAGKTDIDVRTAVDGQPIKPDCFYVIPPNKTMTVENGTLRLASRQAGVHKPVNLLFRSLAREYGHRAVGVVLSGTDADGAEGLEEIKAVGGIAMAQEPDTAKFAGMPKSAIATGCVDFVLPPGELATQLLRLARHPYLVSGGDGAVAHEQDRLKVIFRLLLGKNGTDFSRYKRSTVQRRLARRMALCLVEDLDAYIDLLRRDPTEVQALAQDFLIRVTGFFRDPAAYKGLADTVFPALFDNRGTDPVRIWVPGCASGEEAYSIAMVLLEYLSDHASSHHIQIFATDLSDVALEKARTGYYTDTIADEVSAERLNRFFTKLDNHYQISKTVRDLCVFARHDVTRDPPFSRIDLVSCRNLLIYLDQGTQRQIFFVFTLLAKAKRISDARRFRNGGTSF
jgi:two-component system CheB/CheR fusion protein